MQLAEKLLGLFGLTDVKAWIQHTHDRKFNDRRYAVDGSKLRRLGWEQRTKFETALEATVDWYGKFSGWFGDIEGVLTAHPVVKGDQVAEQVEVLIKSGVDQDVKAGAFEQSAMATDEGSGVVLPKVKMQAAAAVMSNGHAQNGGKKRKADMISSE
jgi:dTDP-glucose 4,6-dehydratase